ncbi:uncharacterized protein G2W53_002585 [Senna tora]|uniref:Uncharacterized protein n=1 Tax=Senna tora TaxID=362788 RepID=A0A835CIE3_9FABA|nr:uncharacterized protein G2W53_002585 [Senna tora]
MGTMDSFGHNVIGMKMRDSG